MTVEALKELSERFGSYHWDWIQDGDKTSSIFVFDLSEPDGYDYKTNDEEEYSEFIKYLTDNGIEFQEEETFEQGEEGEDSQGYHYKGPDMKEARVTVHAEGDSVMAKLVKAAKGEIDVGSVKIDDKTDIDITIHETNGGYDVILDGMKVATVMTKDREDKQDSIKKQMKNNMPEFYKTRKGLMLHETRIINSTARQAADKIDKLKKGVSASKINRYIILKNEQGEVIEEVPYSGYQNINEVAQSILERSNIKNGYYDIEEDVNASSMDKPVYVLVTDDGDEWDFDNLEEAQRTQYIFGGKITEKKQDVNAAADEIDIEPFNGMGGESDWISTGTTILTDGNEYEIRTIMFIKTSANDEEVVLARAKNIDTEETAYLILLDGDVDWVADSWDEATEWWNNNYNTEDDDGSWEDGVAPFSGGEDERSFEAYRKQNTEKYGDLDDPKVREQIYQDYLRDWTDGSVEGGMKVKADMILPGTYDYATERAKEIITRQGNSGTITVDNLTKERVLRYLEQNGYTYTIRRKLKSGETELYYRKGVNAECDEWADDGFDDVDNFDADDEFDVEADFMYKEEHAYPDFDNFAEDNQAFDMTTFSQTPVTSSAYDQDPEYWEQAFIEAQEKAANDNDGDSAVWNYLSAKEYAEAMDNTGALDNEIEELYGKEYTQWDGTDKHLDELIE
jgi:hypothetical protein